MAFIPAISAARGRGGRDRAEATGLRTRHPQGTRPATKDADGRRQGCSLTTPSRVCGAGSAPQDYYLLDRDAGAGALEGRLGLLRGLLVDLLQDSLRRAVHQVLGLLQAQAGETAHLLDDLDLLVAS